MSKRFAMLVVCGAILCQAFSQARAVTIDTVPVGNAGNAPDDTGYGAVAYEYRIGTYEVTVGQYSEFLNAVASNDAYGLFDLRMADDLRIAGIARSGSPGSHSYSVIGSPNKPVAYVSWGDAARFANWLHNGQPSGDQDETTTEDGAYMLNGASDNASLNLVTRNSGAAWFLPTENEWYKAAYHKNDGPTGNYWDYPTAMDTPPDSDQPPGSDAPVQSNTANISRDDGIANGYNDGRAVTGSTSYSTSQNYLTDVGAYELSISPYGTFDQAGNLFEWNEAIINGFLRGLRGGSWNTTVLATPSTFRDDGDEPAYQDFYFGFRVATLAIVPEPPSIAMAALGLVGLLTLGWRQRFRRSMSSVLGTTTGKCFAMLFVCGAILCQAFSQARAVTIDTVPVGNAGNAPDDTGYGAVPYSYAIGKYVVTLGQYTEFLNAVATTDPYGLYDSRLATRNAIVGIAQSGSSGSFSYSVIGSAKEPVTYVSWGDAARFANWMHNGQPSGVAAVNSTEDGAYSLNGAVTVAALSSVERNPDASWFLPTEDEWYKAAYYDAGAEHYWRYATGGNTSPVSAPPSGAPNTANYIDEGTGHFAVTGQAFSSTAHYLTDVGAYTATMSPYGAFDMGGNVAQWTESFFVDSARVLRGTSWNMFGYTLDSSWREYAAHSANQGSDVGFRLATPAVVPEPAGIALATIGLACLFGYGHCRRK